MRTSTLNWRGDRLEGLQKDFVWYRFQSDPDYTALAIELASRPAGQRVVFFNFLSNGMSLIWDWGDPAAEAAGPDWTILPPSHIDPITRTPLQHVELMYAAFQVQGVYPTGVMFDWEQGALTTAKAQVLGQKMTELVQHGMDHISLPDADAPWISQYSTWPANEVNTSTHFKTTGDIESVPPAIGTQLQVVTPSMYRPYPFYSHYSMLSASGGDDPEWAGLVQSVNLMIQTTIEGKKFIPWIGEFPWDLSAAIDYWSITGRKWLWRFAADLGCDTVFLFDATHDQAMNLEAEYFANSSPVSQNVNASRLRQNPWPAEYILGYNKSLTKDLFLKERDKEHGI